MNWTVLKAIFRRDFVSYFSNPTGYVFICVFVMLSALAAFWPPDFFSNNLANLDQLNRWLPFILLVFVPAITMSIWAEERRQGTDELLLTLPASDLEVVLGKYLAAVAIYTVALVFSMFSIYLVFSYGLGTPDVGLFLGTYIGYWFVGLAMLSIGMVASFLTGNLTVGFVLGMIFNAPLALFGVADWFIKWPTLAQAIKKWSAAEQFRDFERGVISLAGVSYFVMIAAVMLYLSMVLIGRRHWGGREERESMWAHFLARTLGLLALALGLNMFLSNHNSLRADITSENLNSLAPSTVQLISKLRDDDKVKTIKIDAYVSPQMPAEYAPHKLNLLSTLAELSSLSGGKIQVAVHEVENFSEQAGYAEQAYGIAPQEVQIVERGARERAEIILGAAFASGLDRVVIPFIDKGIPIEYELLRSICTVADEERKKLGVLKTDVQLFGGFSQATMGMTPEARIVAELKKQYNVVEVDPANPIRERYDVLLAVQPSSLTPEAMANFVNAVKSGQPTAIFEDPFPIPQFNGDVPGTAQPKRAPGGMMAMMSGAQPEPKGDITQLWNLLGVDMLGDEIIWQDFNPEPKGSDFIEPEWIFIDEGLTAHRTPHPFNPDDEISSGMSQVLFLMAGAFQPAEKTKLEFTELAVTGRQSGMISYRDFDMSQRTRGLTGVRRVTTSEPFVVAAHVTGKVTNEDDLFLSNKKDGESASADGKDAKDDDSLVGKEPKKSDINVVLVSDIDWIAAIIFRLREMGDSDDMPIDWRFQNVTFALNILDSLAGDDRFIAVRKRVRPHRILTKIEEATEESRKDSLQQQKDFKQETKKQIEAAQMRFNDAIAEVQKTGAGGDSRIVQTQLEITREAEQRKLEVQISTLEKERNKKIKQSERELEMKIRGVQDWYKFLAVIVPPIPPVLLALAVFFHRRKAEQEGVDARRLRFGRAKQADKKRFNDSNSKTI
ncbi:MAG: Gldg family protein [Pirellulales bacterium]